MTTNTNPWLYWSGGEMPVAAGTPIEVIHRSEDNFSEPAGACYSRVWDKSGEDGDIIAYRLVAQPTPSLKWHVNGEPDTGHCDKERPGLVLGDFTDDELVDAEFPSYDQISPTMGGVAGWTYTPTVYVKAMKERIRWLSRALEKELAKKTAPDNDELQATADNPATNTSAHTALRDLMNSHKGRCETK